jgi:signal transduction histidine kinase
MVHLGVQNAAGELAAEQLEGLFDRFVQGDSSFARREGGVGLGLNLVRAIAELHGGKAWSELIDPGRVEFAVRVPQG